MLMQRQVDNLGIRTYADRQAMGAAAAEDIAAVLQRRLEQADRARIIFASAPSQREMLQQLALHQAIDWSRVSAFHMDEYIGLAPDSPQRFAHWLGRHFFSSVNPARVHLLQPEPDPLQTAQRYAELLAAAAIDVCCLGIGVNGHLAFNDPPVADFNDPLDVKIVELDEVCRQQQVDDDCFARLDEVPVSAITLTIPRLLRAEHLFCVVPGGQKKAAVQAALNGPLSTDCPASILRTHSRCTLYLDQESDPDD